MFKITLLGGSNSVLTNGLKAGLKQENIELKNYALGACTCLQNLYSVVLHKDDILKSDLIITESNVNEIHHMCRIKMPISKISYIINMFYEELFFLNKKILVLILPIQEKCHMDIEVINNLHRVNCIKYGFNLIDMHNYYKASGVNSFFMDLPENHHPMESIMKKIGQNIVLHKDRFKYPKKIHQQKKTRQFIVYIPDRDFSGKYLAKNTRCNSLYSEEFFRITKENKIHFPPEYTGCNLVAIFTWNEIGEYGPFVYSSIVVENKDTTLIKPSNGWMQFSEVHRDFIIDEKTFAFFNYEEREITENSILIHQKKNKLDYIDLISFFLIREYNHFEICNLDLAHKEEKIFSKEYNCDLLIPDLIFLKSAIEEYCIKKEYDSIIQNFKKNITSLEYKVKVFIESEQNYQAQIKRLEYEL
ncbi:TPA: hypothetical protein SC008_001602, partial [Campylobacter jejuni]|nr:hypothetical protein [Campylobacter jejuni]